MNRRFFSLEDKTHLWQLFSGNAMSHTLFQYAVTRVQDTEVQHVDEVFWSVATISAPILHTIGGVALRLEWSRFGRDPAMRVDAAEIAMMSAHARRSRSASPLEVMLYKRWLRTVTVDIVRGATWSHCVAHSLTRFGLVSQAVANDSVVAPGGFNETRDGWVFEALEDAFERESSVAPPTTSSVQQQDTTYRSTKHVHVR